MRTLYSILAAGVAVLGFSSTAGAVAVIDIDWANGSDTITVASSSSIVRANIFLDLTGEPAGSASYSFSVRWDAGLQDLLNVVASSECGSFGSGANPVCAAGAGGDPSGVGPWVLNITAGVTPRNIESTLANQGEWGSYEAGNLPPFPAGGGARHFIGTITFHTNAGAGSTTVNPVFTLGEQVSNGTGTGALATQFDGATLIHAAVPEPGTVALMGLGLLGLAVAGGRRR